MKTTQTHKRNYKIFIVLLLLLVLASVSFFDFTQKRSEKSNESVHDMARKVNENISLTIYNKLNDVEMILNSHALQASLYDNIKDPIIMKVFHEQSLDDNFLDLAIATMDGQKTYARNYEVVDCSNDISFQKARLGETYISQDILADINGKQSITISVPIKKNDKVVGVLQSTIDLNMFTDILKLSCTEEGQNAILVESNGIILARTMNHIKESSIFTHFKHIEIQDENTIQSLKNDITTESTGNVHFIDDNYEYLAYYSNVKGDNNWMIITLFPYQLISTQITSESQQTTQFTLKLVALLLIALLIIIYLERKATSQANNINKQLDTVIDNTTGCLIIYEYKNSKNMRFLNDEFFNISGYTKDEFKELFDNDISNIIHPDDVKPLKVQLYTDLHDDTLNSSSSYSYRIVHKNGDQVWVMDRRRLLKESSGKQWFYITLMDITELKTIQEKLRISQKRYEMIIEQTESVVFEWDVLHDSITLSNLWTQKFGYECVYHDFLTIVCRKFQYEKDSFIPLLEGFITGQASGQIECRVQKANKEYIWCKINARAIKDSFGYLLTVFGSIEDIDDAKEKTLMLEEKSRIDGLTKLLNKVTVQDQIIETMRQQPNKKHVLFVIDVDDFKVVNDTMGHAVGDDVLAQIGATISGCFRGDDIVGRIGGDEFVAFMKNISEQDTTMIHHKIERLHRALSSIRVKTKEDKNVTCSVGVATYPDDGGTYEELFNSADQALYYAKRNGKDMCYTNYERKEDET